MSIQTIANDFENRSKSYTLSLFCCICTLILKQADCFIYIYMDFSPCISLH